MCTDKNSDKPGSPAGFIAQGFTTVRNYQVSFPFGQMPGNSRHPCNPDCHTRTPEMHEGKRSSHITMYYRFS
jgi:hypothetical protein